MGLGEEGRKGWGQGRGDCKAPEGDDGGWAGGRKEVTILWGQQGGGSCDSEKGQLGWSRGVNAWVEGHPHFYTQNGPVLW